MALRLRSGWVSGKYCTLEAQAALLILVFASPACSHTYSHN